MQVSPQTAESLKSAAVIAVGGAGLATSWTLLEMATLAATIVSVFVGLATFAYMVSMVWLNIKKGKQIDKTGITKAPFKKAS